MLTALALGQPYYVLFVETRLSDRHKRRIEQRWEATRAPTPEDGDDADIPGSYCPDCPFCTIVLFHSSSGSRKKIICAQNAAAISVMKAASGDVNRFNVFPSGIKRSAKYVL